MFDYVKKKWEFLIEIYQFHENKITTNNGQLTIMSC